MGMKTRVLIDQLTTLLSLPTALTIYDSSRSLLRLVLVAVRILRLPPPRIFAHVSQRLLGLPPEHCLRLPRVRPELWQVPSSPRADLVGHLLADSLAHRRAHFENAHGLSAPKIEYLPEGAGLLQALKRGH